MHNILHTDDHLASVGPHSPSIPCLSNLFLSENSQSLLPVLRLMSYVSWLFTFYCTFP